MKFKELKYLWYSDLYRYDGKADLRTFISHFMKTPGYKYMFFLRLCKYLKKCKFNKVLKGTYIFFNMILRHYKYKYGIDIQVDMDIREGFYVGHFGGIIVNGKAIVGKNCNISQGVTIGQANRGRNKGYPIIGEQVYIGPGVKIVGAVNIGNNVAIGANCVVTRDIPDNAVVVGIPGEVISYKGSHGYVNNIDY